MIVTGPNQFQFDIELLTRTCSFDQGGSKKIPPVVAERIRTLIRTNALPMLEALVIRECLHSKETEPELWVPTEDPTPNLYHTEPN